MTEIFRWVICTWLYDTALKVRVLEVVSNMILRLKNYLPLKRDINIVYLMTASLNTCELVETLMCVCDITSVCPGHFKADVYNTASILWIPTVFVC